MMRYRLLAVTGLALLSASLVYFAFRQPSPDGSAPHRDAPTAGARPTTPPPPEATPPKMRGAPVPRDSAAGMPAIPAFPWPPPAPSAEHQIRNAWVSKGERTKLADVAEKLEVALDAASYETWRYSSVPRGFALVTQLEQIRPDGTPRLGKERFRADLPSLGDMTFVEYLRALAKAPPGYYRVIVFIVTDTPFSRVDKKPSADEARRWLDVGLNQLPTSMGVLPYKEGYRTTALIYEFKKLAKDEPAAFVPKSLESGKTHLERARILDALAR